jgi:ubiquinone/menaquinone biosynthesis C-methylase UbiE
MTWSVKIKRKVAEIYDRKHEILPTDQEDSMTSLTSLLLRDLEIPENPVTLDIGCGTGNSTLELYKKCNQKGTFYGVDISRKSISLAIKKADKIGCNNIQFQHGDAEELRFPDSTFDIVIGSMCFQFVPLKQKALAEIRRVLKPGGVVALLYPGRLQYHEPRKILLKVAERYPDSPELLSAVKENDNLLIDLEESIDLFREAGFIDSYLHGVHMISYPKPDWFIDSLSGTWGLWKTGLAPSLIDRVHRDLLTEFQNRSTAYGFKLTSYLIRAKGTKPQLKP